MRHREPTNTQVLDASMRVVADERESMRRELQEMAEARDEQLEQLSSKFAEKMNCS